jgi:hypothetical protein
VIGWFGVPYQTLRRATSQPAGCFEEFGSGPVGASALEDFASSAFGPGDDFAGAPNLAHSEDDDRLGEGRMVGELCDALPADAEHAADLCAAYELVHVCMDDHRRNDTRRLDSGSSGTGH